MKILAIETSCDETAAAIVEDGTKILSNVVATSAQMHQKYGGIVPEIAARKQVESIIPVLTEALINNPNILCHSHENGNLKINKEKIPDQVGNDLLSTINAIAVTVGPGLIGSLLVGVETAKTLSLVSNKPLIPVNHVIAHMYANFVETDNVQQNLKNNYSSNSDEHRSEKLTRNSSHPFGDSNNKIEFPAVSLVVSGGHTELYLMTAPNKLKWLGGTIDDAAGECFDKAARILGFGSGGGLAIQKSALEFVRHRFITHPNPLFEKREGNSPLFQRRDTERLNNATIKQFNLPRRRAGNLTITRLPRPMLYDKTLNFSFSGLKTALMREVAKYPVIARKVYPERSRRAAIFLIQQLSFELQEAITDVLVKKTLSAVEIYHAKSILISGGVASNLRLREKFNHAIAKNYQLNNCHPEAKPKDLPNNFMAGEDSSSDVHRTQNDKNIGFFAPQINLCTDNAAFIASYAYFHQTPVDWKKITALPDLSVEI